MRAARLTTALLAAILLAGALVRVAYLRELVHEPTFAHPEVDALYHDYWSRALVSGDWTPPPDCEDPRISTTPYLRPPGYPYFLAAVRKAFGPGYLAPRVVQALLGLCGAALGFALARRRFGPGPALVYAGLLSSCWSFVYFEGEFLEPALLVPLGLLLLLLLDRWTDGLTIRRSAAAGVVLGLMIVVRPPSGLFGALVPLWALASRRGRQRTGGAAAIPALAAFAAAALIVVLPVTVRNFKSGGSFVPVSANGSLNFLLGNNRDATGQALPALPGLGPFATCFDFPGLVRALEREAGRRLSPGEVAAGFRRRAFAFIREQPGRFLALTARRALLFWGPLEVSHNRQDEIVRERSPTLRSLPVTFPVAAASCVLGLLVFVRDGRRGAPGAAPAGRRAQAALLALSVLFVLAVFLAHLPFFIAGRYRVPAVPALLLPGAYGLWRVGEELRSGRLRTGLLWVAVWALLLLVFTRNPTGYAPDAGAWLFERGRALSAEGDAAGARRVYEEIIRSDGGNARAHVNLGLLLMNANELAGAEDHLRRAAGLDARDPASAYDLGLCLVRAGRYAEARAAFAEAVARDPGFVPARTALGRELERAGEALEAARHYGEAALLNRDARELRRLGVDLEILGEPEEAARFLRAAGAIDPGSAPERAVPPGHPVP